MELFIYLFAALFSVLNPIGTVPIFVGLTQGYTKAERSKVSLLTSFNVFVILIISFFPGNSGRKVRISSSKLNLFSFINAQAQAAVNCFAIEARLKTVESEFFTLYSKLAKPILFE